MGINDGSVVSTIKIVDHGPDEDRWNLVITGDGFMSGELPTFRNEVTAFVQWLQNNLSTSQNWNRVNVIRMDVQSDQSGCDWRNCNQNVAVDTYFDAKFCIAGLDRTLEVDEGLVIQAANQNFPEWDALLCFVNIPEYGGLGRGGVAVASLDPSFKWKIALHEMGHAAFKLADEYEFWAGCDSGETDHDNYPFALWGEPPEENVTATLNPLKWQSFVTPNTAIPTLPNADCNTCNEDPDPMPGAVGAYEGAKYYHCGCWKPQYECKMDDLNRDWCVVCADRVDHYLNMVQCFVASAVYGDPYAADVEAIRRWRDRHLEPGARGRPLMSWVSETYNRYGPQLAKRVRPHDGVARILRRGVLGPWAAIVRRGEEART